jgi:hypothetical protein
MNVKTLVSFDFDKTLCLTPEPEDGKILFKNKTGENWPHRGWWGRSETLDLDTFDIPLNLDVYEEYLSYYGKDETYVILATGRLKKLESEVEKILEFHNIVFDEVHLNPGMDTFLFKKNLFEKLIFKFRPDIFIMFDDREEHLIRFEDWAKTQPCEIHINDVVNKTIVKINKN